MNDKPSPDARPAGPDRWETAVQTAAAAFAYPPTPDLAAGVRARLGRDQRGSAAGPTRRLAWAMIALMLALAGLLAVPQVRAAIIEVLQVGGIRIFVVPPTPTRIPPTSTLAPAAAAQPLAATTTPPPTGTPLASVLDLAGETTLDEAQRQTGFTIRLPAYPPDLGAPDRVFLQQLGGPVVVLVWTAPGQPDIVRLSLHEFGPDTHAEKFEPKVVQETTVNGARAAWTEGPHLLVFRSGDAGLRELVHGHTLIWQQGSITYRLETDQNLQEAIRIAQSVR